MRFCIEIAVAAFRKLEARDTVQRVGLVTLWVAAGALITEELLFRYMLGVAKRVKSSLRVANAWHARSQAAPFLGAASVPSAIWRAIRSSISVEPATTSQWPHASV